MHETTLMHVNHAECRCLSFVNLITWVYQKTQQFKLYKCHSFALRLYFHDSYEWPGNETLESLGDSYMILKLKNLFSDITGETKNKYKGPCQILFKIPFCLIYRCLYMAISINIKRYLQVDHFRISKTLAFKMRLSAKYFM